MGATPLYEKIYLPVSPAIEHTQPPLLALDQCRKCGALLPPTGEWAQTKHSEHHRLNDTF